MSIRISSIVQVLRIKIKPAEDVPEVITDIFQIYGVNI